MVLSTAYLGNIQYYSKLLSSQTLIDTHENYLKQSFRNRCQILGANGVQTLTVPVLQPGGTKVATQQIRIDASKRWQHTHWQAIASAYRNSPFFVHYQQALAVHYQRPYTYLVELNEALQESILRLLGLPVHVLHSDAYVQEVAPGQDFRTSLSPKPRLQRPDPAFICPEYYQVFAERMAFAPNLSILDLLFCEGPAAADLLRQTIRP